MASSSQLLVCFLVAAFAVSRHPSTAKEIGAIFEPKWHDVNDYDLNGQKCSVRRPEVTVNCPPFGVLATDAKGTPLRQTEIENACTKAGFVPCGVGESLFPDGSCSSCQSGWQVGGDGTGDLWCVSGNEKQTFNNAFSCLEKTLYRQCHFGNLSDTNQLSNATIQHYYKGDNLQDQATMKACATKAKITDESTDVLLVDTVTRPYQFPMVYKHDDKRAHGFLQCPKKPPAKYSFAASLWIHYYVIWVLGLTYIALFSGYKWLRQKNVRGHKLRSSAAAGENEGYDTYQEDEAFEPLDDLEKKGNRAKRLDTASTEETVISDGQVEEQTYTQIGYSDTIIGKIGLYVLHALTLSLVIWIILLILDVYGVLWRHCDQSVIDSCTKLGDEAYQWRTGYACAANCFFGSMWTTGQMTFWPYFKYLGGAPQQNVIFIISWHFVVVYLFVLLLIQTRIRTFFRVMCPLKQASTVQMSRGREEEIRVATEDGWETKLLGFFSKCRLKVFGPPMVTYTCKVMTDSFDIKYFDFQCMRYAWNEYYGGYFIATVAVGDGTQGGLKALQEGLTEAVARRRIEQIGLNAIHVPTPNIFQAFCQEFMGSFYLYQFSCLTVWYAFWFWPMGCAITTVVLVAGGINMASKRKSQMKVKKISENSTTVTCLRGGNWKSLNSDNLAPGDVLSIKAEDKVAADCAILDGRCVVDESSLTGEPMPVPKIAVENSERKYDMGPADMKFSLLCGTTIQSTSPGQSGHALVLVLSTGSRTSKGSLVKSILHPAPLTFKFDIHWRVVFGMLMLWGLVMFGVCYYMIDGHISSWYYGIFTISQICSPLIPAGFVVSRANGANRLRNQWDVFCVSIDRVAVAGKVRIFCFDKTGTLTNSGLDFVGVEAVEPKGDDIQFGGVALDDDIPPLMSDLIACCHEIDAIPVSQSEFVTPEQEEEHESIWTRFMSLGRPKKSQMVVGEASDVVVNGMRLCGNEVDRKMFEASGFLIQELSSQPLLHSPMRNRRLRVLRRFEFDRETMTMSAIVEVPDTKPKERYVFAKGSHEAIKSKALDYTLPDNFDSRANYLASEGLYVLAVAWKPYDGPDDTSLADRKLMEKDLSLAGFVLFENRLKPETAEVIEMLKAGATRPVMITGDNAQTAMKIAKECTLSTSRRLILGNFVRDSVIWTDAATNEKITSVNSIRPELMDGSTELVVSGHAFTALCHQTTSQCPVFTDIASEEPTGSTRGSETSTMQDLLPYTRIFARMKPDQKVEAVKMHMTMGITGMCGDGANDAGALRMAHVGIALASGAGDASIVAPFSTPHESLTAVIAVLREGRAALANALAAYKFLLMYGETMVLLSISSYYFSAIIAEPFWILIDSFVNIGLGWAIMQAKARKDLTPKRPTCKLIGLEVCTSLISQILLNFVIVIVGLGVLFNHNFFVCKEFDPNLVSPERWWLKGDNYESMVIGLLTMGQFINSAFIFNMGFDFRRRWFRNFWLIGFWLVGAALTMFLVFSDPSTISCLFRFNCGDRSLLERWSSLGRIKYSGPISTAPVGCSCKEQVLLSETCEAEYLNCTKDKYNQTYHHNITPMSFRWVLFGLIITNCILGCFIEGFFIVGPVRRWLRRKKEARQNRTKDSNRVRAETVRSLESSSRSGTQCDIELVKVSVQKSP